MCVKKVSNQETCHVTFRSEEEVGEKKQTDPQTHRRLTL